MNQPIARLFGSSSLLFALLVAFTSRWTVFEASALRANPLNARPLLEQQRIQRGAILAGQRHRARAQRARPRRHLPAHLPFGRTVRARRSATTRTRPRQHRPRALPQRRAHRPAAARTCRSILDQLQGKEPRATRSSRRSTRSAQQVASAALGGHDGAVVAIEPRTGAISVGLDAQLRPQRAALDRARRQARELNASPGESAGQPRHPVRLRPRLDLQGRDRDRRDRHRPLHARIDASAGATPSSSPGSRCRTTTARATAVTLSDALTNSINTVWAQVAEHVGSARCSATWNASASTASPSSTIPPTRCRPAASIYGEQHRSRPPARRVDVGRVGIGEGRLEVDAAADGEVAAAVANHGR